MISTTYHYSRVDLLNGELKKAIVSTSGTKKQQRDVEIVAAVLRKIQK
jgi:hypothetical protein